MEGPGGDPVNRHSMTANRPNAGRKTAATRSPPSSGPALPPADRGRRPLPTAPGRTTVQSEDLGKWVQAQRLNWDQLLPAQAWMLENMLGIGPAGPEERPQAARTQADKWKVNMRAREGSLQVVPRKAVERITEPDGSVTQVRLGTFIDNARRRTDKLGEERRAELTELGMRW